MLISKGHVFRAQPTNQQEAALGRCAGAARYAWNWVLHYCEEEYRVAREAAIAADDYKRHKNGSLVMVTVGKGKKKRERPIPKAHEYRSDVIETRRIEALARDADDWIDVVVKKGKNAGQTKRVLNLKPYRIGQGTWEGRLNGALNEHRNTEARWLWDLPVHCYSNAASRVAKTYQRFFSGTGGKPHYKRRGKHDSFTIQIDQRDIGYRKIRIPKVGWIRTSVEDPLQVIQGEVISLTVTHRVGASSVKSTGKKKKKNPSGWWELSVTARDITIPDPTTRIGPILGIDLGINAICTIARSDRPDVVESIDPPRPLMRNLEHLVRLQIRFDQRTDTLRCETCDADTAIVPGLKRGKRPRICECGGRLRLHRSNRAQKLQMRINRMHYRIAQVRKDHLHKLSDKLTGLEVGARRIVVEGHDITELVSKGVAKTKKGKRKRNTRRAMLDMGWGEFRRQLEYKSEWRGVQCVKPEKFKATDMPCSKCLTLNKMPDNTSEYLCSECGHKTTRQANTAWFLVGYTDEPTTISPGKPGEGPRVTRHQDAAQPRKTSIRSAPQLGGINGDGVSGVNICMNEDVPPARKGRGEPRTADAQVRSASTPSKPKMDV